MPTLKEALEKLAVCIAPHAKQSRPLVRIHDGVLYAYNGTLAGRSPFTADLPSEPFVVDAESLKRVWTDDAKASIKNNTLTIRNRRTSYSIRVLDDIFECPALRGGGELITEEQCAAILLASKFASTNAQQSWARGVLIHDGRAVATNNVSIVSVECGISINATLPIWAVHALDAAKEAPVFRADDTGITFTFEDGTIIHSAPLASQMPDKLFELVASLTDGDVDLKPIKDVAEDAFRIPGHVVTINPRSSKLIVVSEQGNKSETDIDLSHDADPVTLQEPVLKLILKYATHVGFDYSPDKLLFSSDAAPRFNGVAAAMSV